MTITSKEHETLFPEPSTNVYVTADVPIGKACPGLWVAVSVWMPELSVAVGGVQFSVPVFAPRSLIQYRLCGHLWRTGFSLSE